MPDLTELERIELKIDLTEARVDSVLQKLNAIGGLISAGLMAVDAIVKGEVPQDPPPEFVRACERFDEVFREDLP